MTDSKPSPSSGSATPGPWYASDESSEVAYVFANEERTDILAMAMWRGHAPAADLEAAAVAETFANARLMAAAPLLLKAARLDKQAEEFDCPHDAEHRCKCGDVQSDLVHEARRAREAGLRKAEGHV